MITLYNSKPKIRQTMIPVMRCFTCNNVLGHKAQVYRDFLKAKEDKNSKQMDADKMLDSLEVFRICCRRHLQTDIDIIEDNAPVK